jgi:plasmid maintenance system antidote protein VapI
LSTGNLFGILIFMKPAMADQLRAKIRECGMSAAALGKIVDVKQQTISEFLRGQGITLATAQKLADHFGLRLTGQKSD